MSKLTEIFWDFAPKSWCSVGKGSVAELQIKRMIMTLEGETRKDMMMSEYTRVV